MAITTKPYRNQILVVVLRNGRESVGSVGGVGGVGRNYKTYVFTLRHSSAGLPKFLVYF
ncbi:MAG: hypothetical protein F6K40_04595 [Okeania sp. SIO3I5]|uniref:hypothetical protein n=1 Tax=Okeania sp. SIO3I5 TaxID=2607805 RepID=UPI0013BBD130|nr:hypothetical protein [Okeania sp. SIO3I5]NEQ35614.1 hypothetical protein [Okeania sp. SIO3I5]